MGVGLRKAARWFRAVDHATTKMAIRQSSVGRGKTDALTAAQTHFDSRDRLAGRLDDATVRQATEVDL